MVAIVLLGTLTDYQNEIAKAIINQIDEFAEDAVIVNPFKTDKMLKLVRNKETKILNFDFEIDGLVDYEEYKKMIQRKFSKIDKVILVKTPIMSGFSYNNLYLINKLSNSIEKSSFKENKKLNFQIVKTLFKKLIFVKAIGELQKQVIQFVIDPQEVDFSKVDLLRFKSYKRFFILKNDNSKYCPMYEYEYARLRDMICDKTLDLFFIASIVSPERNWLYDLRNAVKEQSSLENSNIDFNVFDGKENRKNRISQTKYYEKLSKSRYTLIIKPYEQSSFSIIRFIEAVNLQCVPLILDDCNLMELENTFEDIYKIVIENNLIVSREQIYSRIKNYEVDREVISKILSSPSYKKITDYKKVKSFYDKLLSKED